MLNRLAIQKPALRHSKQHMTTTRNFKRLYFTPHTAPSWSGHSAEPPHCYACGSRFFVAITAYFGGHKPLRPSSSRASRDFGHPQRAAVFCRRLKTVEYVAWPSNQLYCTFGVPEDPYAWPTAVRNAHLATRQRSVLSSTIVRGLHQIRSPFVSPRSGGSGLSFNPMFSRPPRPNSTPNGASISLAVLQGTAA